MSYQDVETRTGFDVPHSERGIARPADDPATNYDQRAPSTGATVDLLVAVQMHAAHRRRVPVQGVYAVARFGVPHLQGPVRAAADDRPSGHLRRPDAARVPHQGAQALKQHREKDARAARPRAHLARDGGPHLEGVVVGAAHYPVAAELQTGDDVVVVPLQHLGRPDRLAPPVRLDRVLPHVGGLPRRRLRAERPRGTPPLWYLFDPRLPTLLLPQEVVLGEEAPAAARLRRPEQVLRLEERQHVQRELARQQRDEVPLELGLYHLHHVAHLRRFARGYQFVDRQDPFGVRPFLELRQPVGHLRRRIVLRRDYEPRLLVARSGIYDTESQIK
jgi:hypothetical protein